MSLAFRCGLPHYDFLLPSLTASQLGDIIAFHQKQNLSFDRDDSFWSQHLAMYFNCHRPEGQSAKTPVEFIPWKEQRDVFKNPLSSEELKRKLGFAK
jgi:hypothetical protein